MRSERTIMRRSGSRWFADGPVGPGPNLMTANAAGAETNATGMEVHANTTLARDTAVFRSGVASYRMNATGVTPAIRTPVTAKYSLTAGVSYTASHWGRAATAVRGGWAGIWWYNAANGFIGAANGAVIPASPLGTWTQYTVTGIAPAGTTQGHLVISWDQAVSGEIFHIDDVHLGTT